MSSTKSDVLVDDQDIAIVGMAGRFPGARNLDEFWNNLAAGVESIRPVSDADLRARGVDPALLRDPHHVKAAAVLDGMETFDAGFFGYTPREAELMDPQHRVFLECCWEALEHAGHAPEAFRGAVGVFGGATTNTYLIFNLVSNPELLSGLDQVQIDVGNGADFLSTRVAYKLNLHGPGYTVQSACSTSLVATHVACQSLLAEECDLALAGGVSIHVKHPEGYRYLPGGIVSPDGHCRAFDARAKGTVFGSGVGVVVLRRLKDALADGDHVHAVIKGSAINNDGSVKVGYTAPGVEGQAAVIGEALGAAGVEPETIGYVETHGTGTQLGDPIEIRALTKAFGFRPGKDVASRCPIGSVKTNIGHLAGAAGIASLIKAVLALEHRQIPPTLHFAAPNPEIDFARSPFYVNAQLAEWPAAAEGPRRAGVSSFGVGGTNAHVVLEEAPAQGLATASESARPVQLLVLSAKTDTALEAATAQLGRHLGAHPELALADVAYTLQVGRSAMAHRRVLVCRDRTEAVAALASGDAQKLWTETPSVTERPVAFLFPGQGAQHVNMGRELYETEPVFREHLDACAEALRQHLPGGLDLRTLLYPAPAEAEAAGERLGQTAFTQPALFAIEYALARLWMSFGVRPSAMIGHSIGEYVAACLAGVFSLGDALALVAARGQLMQSLPAGSMLAVFLGPAEIEPRLGPDLSVAAINAPRLTVVAGPTAAIEALEARLKAENVDCQRLHTSHAFHSAMMDPIVGQFTERVRKVKLQAPKIPYVSNVTGRWIEAAQATDPGYWAQHLRQAVRFSAGLETLREQGHAVLLEVGPGQTLGTLARQVDQAGQAAGQAARLVLSSMRHVREQTSDLATLVGTLGKLWLSGVSVDWSAYHAKERRRRVPLPGYPFERKRYWIEARPLGATAGAAPGATAALSSSSTSLEKKSDVADWFYAPSWRRLPPARPVDAQSLAAKRRSWLVFTDEQGLGTTLAERLGQAGQTVTQVVRGSGFARRADGTYAIDPRQREDYDKLLLELTAQGAGPEVIVHLWSVLPGPVSLEHALDVGFYSLLYLAQALGKGERKEPLALWVAANDVHKVESADRPWPEKATLLGPCRVIPQEVPQVTCRFVDVALGRDGGAAGIAGALLGEILTPAEEAVVALRGAQRWAQCFEPLRLTGDGPPVRSLHERGVYLIVDGLAGMGQVLAEDLARTYKARLVLIEGTESSDGPAAQGAEDPARRKQRQVQALEASGAEVLVVRANPTNEDEMRRAVAAGRERFGNIDGVFYAAGGMQGATLRTLQETRPADCAWHFAHQIHGLQVLAWVLPSEGLDFCCLASSLSALLGGLGQVAHAAASHFMDAFAESRNERGTVSWISVDWDAWQFPREDGQPAAALSSTLAQFAIQPAEGREVMRRLLTQAPAGQIVVSTADLEARQRHWEEIYRAQGQGQGPKRSEATRAGHARPALGTPYLAPRSDLEQAIAAVWQQVLGMAEVGVNDNFFELGGHSLLATQLRNHLHEVVRVDLPLRDLFDKPTVAGVAELVEKHRAQQAAAQEKPIRERLRVAFPTEKQAILEEYLHKKIAAGMRLGVDELPRDGSLRQFDLHLLGAELEYDLRQDFKFQLFPHEVQEHPTIPSLARYLLAEMDRQADPTRFLTDRPLSDYKLRPYRKHVTVAGGAGTQAAQGKNPSMVFVHSSPRAGSTLFRVMLAGHPQLFCPPEVNLLFFDNLQEWRQNIGFGHEMEWTTGGLQWAFMELLGIDSAAGQALIDKMLSDNVSAQHVYGRLQELCRPRLLVDKTPSYSLDLETIWRAEAMFDAPKYIYLYRHPYPVMESILRVRFDRLFGPSLFGEVEVDPYVVAETVWALSNRNLLTFFERIGRERCLWVRYEELVAQPEKVMTGVCAFLGIPFDERVLAPYDGKRERMMGGLGDPNLLQHNRIEPDLGEAWKRIKWPRPLDPSTRELVTRLGYEVPEVAPPPPRREAPPAPAAAAKAEELLANLDQLSDEQVAALLAEMSGEGEQ